MRDRKDHKKGHESTIGKIIYGFMLFAPLFGILTSCLYTIFNKNAYKSYNTQSTYQADYGNNNALPVGDYKWIYLNANYQLKYATSQTQTKTIDLTNSNYLFVFNTTNNLTSEVNNSLRINLNNTINIQLNYIVDSNNNYFMYSQVKIDNIGKYSLDIYHHVNNWNTGINGYAIIDTSKFTKNKENIDISLYKDKLIELTNNRTITLDNEVVGNLNNVFYDAINEVENSELFNWSKNSAIYTGIKATAETLDITNTFIPMLLAYWLIMSVFYFLYDIILMILQILHRKIHEIQDSI